MNRVDEITLALNVNYCSNQPSTVKSSLGFDPLFWTGKRLKTIYTSMRLHYPILGEFYCKTKPLEGVDSFNPFCKLLTGCFSIRKSYEMQIDIYCFPPWYF